MLTKSELEAKKVMVINRVPRSLSEFIGNEQIKKMIELTINAVNEKGLQPPHTLVTGQRGTGKTSLAVLSAMEMNKSYKVISASSITKIKDLTELFLHNMPEMLIIDEVHDLIPELSDSIHEAMDQFVYNYLDKEGNIITCKLPLFSLWGLTTDEGLLTAAFYSRFTKKYNLMPYTAFNLQKIVMGVAKNNGIDIDTSGAFEIAIRSNGIPRLAISNLVNVFEYAIKYNHGIIDLQTSKDALDLNGIDSKGLNQVQIDILKVLDAYSTPIGANHLCERMGIGLSGLLKIYEPPLLVYGFIKRMQNGRVITAAGKAHLKKK